MTTEQKYVGKDCYANPAPQPVSTDQNTPVVAPGGHRFTPKLYRVSSAPGQPLSTLSVLLEALFCYQAHLSTLPPSEYRAGLIDALDALIAEGLDTMQRALGGQEGGTDHAL